MSGTIMQNGISINELSGLHRIGIKGPNTAQWLTDHGIAPPANPNCCLIAEGRLMILRLGNSEFMIESAIDHLVFEQLTEASQPVANGVYRVQRTDAAFMLSGEGLSPLLSELCSLDLSEKSLAENTLLLTQFAGISAIVLRQKNSHQAGYRIWCDGTYAAYMRETLQEVALELNAPNRSPQPGGF